MKSFEVKYTKGHLVETKTGKRIFLKRGGVFNILGDDDQFQIKDELQINFKPLDSLKKLNDLKSKHWGYFFKKVADNGQKFVYRIGLSKTTSEEKK